MAVIWVKIVVFFLHFFSEKKYFKKWITWTLVSSEPGNHFLERNETAASVTTVFFKKCHQFFPKFEQRGNKRKKFTQVFFFQI
jgi:hypothetical protein